MADLPAVPIGTASLLAIRFLAWIARTGMPMFRRLIVGWLPNPASMIEVQGRSDQADSREVQIGPGASTLHGMVRVWNRGHFPVSIKRLRFEIACTWGQTEGEVISNQDIPSQSHLDLPFRTFLVGWNTPGRNQVIRGSLKVIYAEDVGPWHHPFVQDLPLDTDLMVRSP